MQFKSKQQTEAELVQDRVFAMMETGNTGQARTIMAELRDSNTVVYSMIRTAVNREYGVSL